MWMIQISTSPILMSFSNPNSPNSFLLVQFKAKWWLHLQMQQIWSLTSYLKWLAKFKSKSMWRYLNVIKCLYGRVIYDEVVLQLLTSGNKSRLLTLSEFSLVAIVCTPSMIKKSHYSKLHWEMLVC